MTDIDNPTAAAATPLDELGALLVDRALLAVAVLSAGRIVHHNERFRLVCGRTAEQLEREGLPDVLARVVADGVEDAEVRLEHEDGVGRDLLVGVIRAGDLTFVEALDTTLANSDRRRVETIESDLDRAFQQAAIGMAVLDANGHFLTVNDSFEQLLGYTQDELAGTSFLDYTHPDDQAMGLEHGTRLLRGEIDRFQIDGRWIRRTGEVAWARLTVALARQPDGSAQYVAQVQDVTEEHRAREELAERQAWYEALIENSNDMLLVINADSTLRWASPAAWRLFGYEQGSQVGRSFSDFIHPDDLDLLIGEYQDLLTHPGELRSVEVRIRHAEGDVFRNAEIVATNHLDNPAVTGVVANIRDITERVEAAERIEYQAFHDALTGLANRALLLDRLAHAVERSKRTGERIALLFLDLDRFKLVNDSLGHEAGDRLLVEVAGRLVDAVRAHDTVARLGGDEFVVLVEGLHHDGEVEIIAERIRDSLGAPVVLGDNEVTISASIGIAFDTEHSPDALLRDADTALYRAKDRGKNRFEVFDESLRAEAVHRLQTDRELRRALDGDRIVTHYQPIVSLADGRLLAVEALVRYVGSNGHLHHPGEFLAVAEETGLIVPIGAEVIEQACDDLARWRDRFGLEAPPQVNINVAARQLGSPELRFCLDRCVDRAGLEPMSVVLEYTESTAISADRSTTKIVELMHDQGYGLAIDDFGTGYSSLAYLKRFPVDTVKLDRHFVSGLGSSSDDLEIVRAVLSLARSLNLTTVAEGVEDAGQVTLLRSLGCDRAQGYLIARPLPFDELSARIAAGRAWLPEPEGTVSG